MKPIPSCLAVCSILLPCLTCNVSSLASNDIASSVNKNKSVFDSSPSPPTGTSSAMTEGSESMSDSSTSLVTTTLSMTSQEDSTSTTGCLQDCSNHVCGNDPVCSESCGTCENPLAICESNLIEGYCTITIGSTDLGPNTVQIDSDVIYGQQIILPQSDALYLQARQLGIYVPDAPPGSNIKIAIYGDINNNPTIPQTSVSIPLSSAKDVQSGEPAVFAALAPEVTYWIVLKTDTPNLQIGRNEDQTLTFIDASNYDGDFPDLTMNSPAIGNDFRLSTFIILEEVFQ